MKQTLYCFILLFMHLSASGQCFEDRHSTLLEDYWISCTLEESPNSQRQNSHWIMYDFGDVHRIGTSHFWNINRPGYTNMGSKSITIDYSNDGVSWLEWGVLELDEAEANSFYEGQEGPDFEGLAARYILLTIDDNYGSNCSGLAEVRFESLGLTTSTEETAFFNTSLDLAPNPAHDLTRVMLDSPINTDAQISLIDVNGRLIIVNNVTVVQGQNSWELNLSNLSPGTYAVKLTTRDTELSSQLTIINK